MLNEQFVLQSVQPYLNSKREISEFEFLELFAKLTLHEQYEVINIFINNNIEYVEIKEEEENNIPSDKSTSVEHGDFKKLLNLNNEQLCLMYQNGDTLALSALLEKNKRFVYQLAMKLSAQYRNTSLLLDDLFQEGNIGIIKSAKRFDIEKNNKFLTYSWHWIRQAITRSLMCTGYMIRIPVHMFEKISCINGLRNRNPEAHFMDIYELFCKSESNAECSLDKFNELLAYSEIYLTHTSLNSFVGENEDSELINFIPIQDERSIESMIIEKDLKTQIQKAISNLKLRESIVVAKRFGLEENQPRTLEEIGSEMGVTRERIRQIESLALRKLSRMRDVKILKVYLKEFV